MSKTYTIEEIIKNRRKWVKGLRSGKYVQARYRFVGANREKHCCLAVLCDVLEPKGWKKNGGWTSTNWSHSHEELGRVTEAMRRMVGATYGDMEGFIHMNDQDGCNYDEIAHVVENLPLPAKRPSKKK